jgi:indole-3-glycerol phosphate synthase
MSSILDEIYARKRIEVRAQRARVAPASIAAAATRASKPRDFVAALRGRRPAIIAEIKRASPSKGDIMPGLDPATVAREYIAAGAAAISVLTDVHFKGSLDDLEAVRAAVEVPILRKDFVFDPYQVYEARAAGADCILLIVAMLKEGEMRSIAALARELGMATLVEAHDEDEFRFAETLGTGLVGINNRDLHTFVTDIGVTERLLKNYAGTSVVVSESGIDTAMDIRRLDDAGARAFLIGESLLRGGAPRAKLTELMNALQATERPAQ